MGYQKYKIWHVICCFKHVHNEEDSLISFAIGSPQGGRESLIGWHPEAPHIEFSLAYNFGKDSLDFHMRI